MGNKIIDEQSWQTLRQELLSAEKAHTQERARLAQLRRELPWCRVDKNYVFVTSTGEQTLSDLFLDRSQLVIYHLMFGDGWEKPCVGCTAWADAFNGTTDTPADAQQYGARDSYVAADARLIAVSRAPIKQIEQRRELNGWTFPWVSSASTEYGIDFYASSEDLSPRSSKRIGEAEDAELVEFDRGENHGVAVFYKDDDGNIFHTYSVHNRGIEAMNGAFGYYDILPKGRAY